MREAQGGVEERGSRHSFSYLKMKFAGIFYFLLDCHNGKLFPVFSGQDFVSHHL